MKKFLRVAQADPLAGGLPTTPPAPAPVADPMAGLGAGAPPATPLPGLSPSPLADPMAGLGTTPAPPQTPGIERQEIIGPITSIAQIFYDMDIAKFIQNNLQINSDKLAKKIWLDYGGKENGQINQSNVGKRTDSNNELSPEKAAEERKNTDKSKWERLEKNKNIGDIISYDDLGKVVEGLIYGVVQKSNAASMAPPGGAPMGGGLMASNKARIIIAKNLEKQGQFKLSDTIIKELIKKLSS